GEVRLKVGVIPQHVLDVRERVGLPAPVPAGHKELRHVPLLNEVRRKPVEDATSKRLVAEVDVGIPLRVDVEGVLLEVEVVLKRRHLSTSGLGTRDASAASRQSSAAERGDCSPPHDPLSCP